MVREGIFCRTEESVWLRVSYHPNSRSDSLRAQRLSKMCVICPYKSAGNVRIM